jgi:phospholipid/cholesterol/gamma-HCH transport system permease protein
MNLSLYVNMTTREEADGARSDGGRLVGVVRAKGGGLSAGRVREAPGPDVVNQWLVNLGSFGSLSAEALRSLFTQKPIWIREAVIQCIFIMRTMLRPALAVNGIFALSIIGLASGIPLEQLGAPDRNAAFLGVGLIREFGVIMTASVFAGVVGTTYTAELGARKIREELEALEVLGVSPVRSIVVPRIVAMCVMSPVIFLGSVVAGALGVYLASTFYFHNPTGPFLPQLLSNTSWIDLWASLTKVVLFGFLIAVISCAKGLNVKGGAEGVGRAVNESVVASLVAVFFINILYTQVELGVFPNLSVFR